MTPDTEAEALIREIRALRHRIEAVVARSPCLRADLSAAIAALWSAADRPTLRLVEPVNFVDMPGSDTVEKP